MTTQAEENVAELLSQAIRIVRGNAGVHLGDEPAVIGQVLQALVLHQAAAEVIEALQDIRDKLDK